jgi:hypothetical protein
MKRRVSPSTRALARILRISSARVMGACVMLTTLLLAGCAQSMQSADTGSAPQAIQVMIENQTGTTMGSARRAHRFARVAPRTRGAVVAQHVPAAVGDDGQ